MVDDWRAIQMVADIMAASLTEPVEFVAAHVLESARREQWADDLIDDARFMANNQGVRVETLKAFEAHLNNALCRRYFPALR